MQLSVKSQSLNGGARMYTAAYTGTLRVLYLLLCVLCVACNEQLVELLYRALIGPCIGYCACSL